MKILFLTQILPYPPNAGPRVKTWHLVKHLAAMGAQITLVTFIREEEKVYLPEVKKICEQLITIPIKRSRIKDIGYLIKSILKNSSFLITRDQSPAFLQSITKLINQQPFDFIHADQLTMAQFALKAKTTHLKTYPEQKPPILIFDAHNATWTILERMQSQVFPLLRPLVKWEKERIKTYEGFLLQTFDHTLAVTEIDQNALLSTLPPSTKMHSKLHVIPIAVDTVQLSPVSRRPDTHHIITLGTLHYPPNADGIRWFMRDVFPRIHDADPLAKLTVIGKNPPKDFFQYQNRYPQSIQITGYVENLLPYLAEAAVMVVPVLAGGGMRVRILEAFSRQIPVVTTTIGLEGIDAVPEQDVYLADQVDEFTKAVIRLLNSPEEQQRISSNGRNLVCKKYDWKTVFTAINRIYQWL